MSVRAYLLTIALAAATVLVALFLLRNELRDCFGCHAGSSVSNAPGP